MKHIEDYYHKHAGEEIWILGCGPALDDYPDDFFDDKITIAIKFTFSIFPKCTYIITSHSLTPDWLVAHQPEFLNKCILVVFTRPSEEMVWYKKEYGDGPIWMQTVHPSIPHKSVEEVTEDYRQMVKAVVEGTSVLYQALWSQQHCAITASVIFDAKKITLTGCDMKASKNRWHSEKIIKAGHYGGVELREYSEEWQKGETVSARIVRRGTSLLAELYKPYGINIRRHHYKTGYEEIEPLEYWKNWGLGNWTTRDSRK